MTLRRSLYPAALTLLLAACGDDDDSPTVAGDPDAAASGSFADSDAFTERFGTRTARDENPDVDEATLDALVTALNGFSLELHRAVASADPDAEAIGAGARVRRSACTCIHPVCGRCGVSARMKRRVRSAPSDTPPARSRP